MFYTISTAAVVNLKYRNCGRNERRTNAELNLLNCPHNEMKLKQNSWKTVSKQFLNSF